MKCINNTLIITRLLVGPPTSRGYPLQAHHELQQAEFTMKVKNAVLALFWQCEKLKTEYNKFISNLMAILLA